MLMELLESLPDRSDDEIRKIFLFQRELTHNHLILVVLKQAFEYCQSPNDYTQATVSEAVRKCIEMLEK